MKWEIRHKIYCVYIVCFNVQPVCESERNGIIRGYEVHNDDSGGRLTVVNSSDVFYVRVLLSPTVNYSVSLTAFSDVGQSPPAIVNIRAVVAQRQYHTTLSLSVCLSVPLCVSVSVTTVSGKSNVV